MFLPKTPFSIKNEVGVSLDTFAVRAVIVAGNNQIVSTEEVLVDEPFFVSDRCNGKLLVESLTLLKKKAGITNQYVSICIPEKYAFSRQHTLPKLKESELDEAISWQIESIFPFKKEEVYTDWRLVSQSATETKVHVVAIPIAVLDQIKNACEAASLYPIGFEPSALALSRLTNFDDKDGILVELNRGGSTSTAISKGISLLTSTTFFRDTSNPQDVLKDLLNSVLSVERQFNDKEYSIAITGEKATPQIASLLETQLNHPVQVLEHKNIPTAFHTAYAAATSLVKPPSSMQTINILPQKLREYYDVKIAYENAKASISLVVACVAIAVFSFLALTGYLAWQIAALSEVNTMAGLETTVAPNGLNPPQLISGAQKINLLFPKKVGPEEVMTTIISETPTDIVITRVQFDKTKNMYSISGQAPSRESLLTYRQHLTAIEMIGKVVLPLASLEAEANPLFTMEITVKPKTL